MAASTTVNTPETKPGAKLSLWILREELQPTREVVLVQTKTETVTSFKENKTEIPSLMEETRADIRTTDDEQAGELVRLCLAQTEAASNYEEMGNTGHMSEFRRT